MDRSVSITQDINGHSIVIINDILFKRKRSINWNDVEAYLHRYVGILRDSCDRRCHLY